MNKMLILTAAVGYGQGVKDAFIQNLRSKGFKGTIEILDWTPNKAVPFFTERVQQYRDTIARLSAGFDTVMTTDLRDVLFQGNPEDIEHSDLDLFLEDASVKIRDCPYNSSWIRTGWGQDGLDLVGHNSISCAGVVIGTPTGMNAYYDRMWQMCQAGYAMVVDQGIHNYLLWTGKFAGIPARVVANEAGAVYTLQYVDGIVVKNHRILNRAGKPRSYVISMIATWRNYERHYYRYGIARKTFTS